MCFFHPNGIRPNCNKFPSNVLCHTLLRFKSTFICLDQLHWSCTYFAITTDRMWFDVQFNTNNSHSFIRNACIPWFQLLFGFFFSLDKLIIIICNIRKHIICAFSHLNHKICMQALDRCNLFECMIVFFAIKIVHYTRRSNFLTQYEIIWKNQWICMMSIAGSTKCTFCTVRSFGVWCVSPAMEVLNVRNAKNDAEISDECHIWPSCVGRTLHSVIRYVDIDCQCTE